MPSFTVRLTFLMQDITGFEVDLKNRDYAGGYKNRRGVFCGTQMGPTPRKAQCGGNIQLF